MIARLSKRMASFLVCNEIIEDEDQEVYEYGLQLLLSTIFNGVIALAIAIISQSIIPCICFLVTFIIMRQAAGGFHAKTHLGCCCILIAVLIIFVALIKFLPVEIYILIAIICSIFSITIILVFAPVEHKNKPINEMDRLRLRKQSILFITVIVSIVILLGVLKLEVLMLSTILGAFTASCSIVVAKWLG